VMGLSQATSDGEQAAVFLQKQKKSWVAIKYNCLFLGYL
jgi:hypothetical protein